MVHGRFDVRSDPRVRQASPDQHEGAAGAPRRRPVEPRPRPPTARPAGRLRRLRRLGPGEEVAKLTYFGLYALQHRGQEAAGIAVSDGSGVVVYKDLGLVAQVFDEPTLASLRGHLAIGHTRYSTTGGSTWENAQPTIRATTPARRSRWPTTATWSTPPSCAARWPSGAALDGATSDTALVTTLLASRPICRSRPPRWRCCRRCAARSASSSWTRPPSTPPVTRTAYARWCSAGWSAAGWWRARPRRWTSSAPAWCGRSSRAS